MLKIASALVHTGTMNAGPRSAAYTLTIQMHKMQTLREGGSGMKGAMNASIQYELTWLETVT